MGVLSLAFLRGQRSSLDTRQIPLCRSAARGDRTSGYGIFSLFSACLSVFGLSLLLGASLQSAQAANQVVEIIHEAGSLHDDVLLEWTDPFTGLRMSTTNYLDAELVVTGPSNALVSLWRYDYAGTGSRQWPLSRTGQCRTGTGVQITLAGPKPDGLPVIAVGSTIPLLPATRFVAGEPLFVRVQDADRDQDASVAEELLVQLTASSGDSEIVQLWETGPGTGIFEGYIQLAASTSGTGDCLFQADKGATVTLSYSDDVSEDSPSGAIVRETSALVDPFGLVFDSTTGLPLSGVSVRLEHVDGSLVAGNDLRGDDGAANFPNPLLTGSTFSHGSVTYQFADGQYRFPQLTSGQSYRLVVAPPAGYHAPSGRTAAELASLPGGPFVLDNNGSYQQVFAVPAGSPPQRIDIPLDPASSGLFVAKTAARTVVSAGDFLPYHVTVSNSSGALFTGVTLRDRLPVGVRYRQGSLRIDKADAPDPQISSDGRTLMFTLGALPDGVSREIEYVTEVSAAAPLGVAVNTVQATSVVPAVVSNEARAQVIVREELMRSRSIVMGRIMEVDGCDSSQRRVGKGVQGIKLFTEEGRYVVSDNKGRYHFEHLKPGSHVLQIDTETLPDHLELLRCEQDTRAAGTNESRFVDLQGGSLWQQDFYLRRPVPVGIELNPVQGRLWHGLQAEVLPQQVAGQAPTLRYTLTTHAIHATARELQAEMELPASVKLLDDSVTVNGKPVLAPELQNGVLTFTLGDLRSTDDSAAASITLVFDARFIAQAQPGPYRVRANVSYRDQDGAQIRAENSVSAVVATTDAAADAEKSSAEKSAEPAAPLLSRQSMGELTTDMEYSRHETPSRIIVVRPKFDSYSWDLAEGDKKLFRDLPAELGKVEGLRLEVVGHTDNVRVVPRKGRTINDNQSLSQARAAAVASYLKMLLNLDDVQISSEGRGDSEPVQDNSKPEGRKFNRRVELKVYTSAQQGDARVALLSGASSESEPLLFSSWQSNYVIDAVRYRADGSVILPEAATASGEADASGPSSERIDGNGEHFSDSLPEEEVDDPEAMQQGILSLHEGDVLPYRVNAIRVQMDSRLRMELLLDGEPVPSDRIGFSKKYAKYQRTLYSFVGVDMGDPGAHTLELRGLDPFGNARFSQSLSVVRSSEIALIRQLDNAANVADGKTPVTARVQLVDRAGNVIPARMMLAIQSGDLQAPLPRINELPTTGGRKEIEVAADGSLRFAPVAQAGLYRFEIGYNAIRLKGEVYVQPQKRDWILVGMAEGTLSANNLSGNNENLNAADHSEDLLQDGRVAFYAKGMVRGEWLLTMAYDSNRERAEAFQKAINPAAYYTVYQDATETGTDAASRRKLFVRIERDVFSALFGDFNTAFTVTELARYTRQFTGLKTDYHGRRFAMSTFVTETGQAFLREEIRGDGTSGLYTLPQFAARRAGDGSARIMDGSDHLRIETRDRFHPEQVLAARELQAYTDYVLDHDSGQLYFRAPVLSQDEAFNPVFIVVSYEVDGRDNQSTTAGTRMSYKLMENRVEVGTTLVHEGNTGARADLQGIDVKVQLDANRVLRVENASSSVDAIAGDRSGQASLIEFRQEGARVAGRVYAREQDGDFGVGQLSVQGSGVRTMGAEWRYLLDDHWSALGSTYRQQDIDNGSERSVLDLRGQYQTELMRTTAGLRATQDQYATGDSASVNQLAGSTEYRLLDKRLTLRGSAETSVGGSPIADLADRLTLGADYRISPKVTALAAQEYAWSDTRDTQTTRLGARTAPWAGARIDTLLEDRIDEQSDRLAATLGLKQSLTLNAAWNAEMTFDRAMVLSEERYPVISNNLAPATPSNSTTGDFWASSVGANYHEGQWRGQGRVEFRDSTTEDKWNLAAGIFHERSESLGLSAEFMASLRNGVVSDQDNISLRLGAAWRPLDVRRIYLDRLDLIWDNSESAALQLRGRRIVNNLNVSTAFEERGQLSLQYGMRYVFDTINGDFYHGFTDLMGAEYRFDIDSRNDLGVRFSRMASYGTGTEELSYGVSWGFSPVKNGWFSVGYNFAGFHDDDFSAADYTAQGIYLKMRMKFDQYSVRRLWREFRQRPAGDE